jgi:ribosomal-protein-alanine N-acetyltransferase
VIRTATPADLPAVRALQAGAFGGEAWSDAQVDEELGRPGGIFLVDVRDGELVGFTVGWVVFEDLHLLQVATSPRLRRQGVGRGLVHALMERARGARQGLLEVHAANASAIALYESLGWIPVARRAAYYKDGGDALVYRAGIPLRDPASPAAP